MHYPHSKNRRVYFSETLILEQKINYRITKKREKVSIFSATLPLLDFYGWVGNSITISTALVNDMRGGIFTPALLR